jgi:type IV pilus assembly protein PilO
MTLDDLNKLNFRDIGNWPNLPKIALLVILLLAIMGAGYWFDWSTQLQTLDASREQEAQLKETFLSKKKQAINLDIYKQQLKDIEQSFGALLRQLPNKSEMDALLTDINQAGLGRGLQFDLFKPSPQETITEFYAERPISIRVTGSYHDLGAFASDISQLSRIVTLDSINVSTGKSGELVMDGIVRTYRYLDEDEVAAQKKAAKGKKGAK